MIIDYQNFSVFKSGKKIFSTDNNGGATPITLAILAHGEDMNGTVIYTHRVGEAAARLLVYAKVSEVYVKVISSPASKIFNAAGIMYHEEKIKSSSNYTSIDGEKEIDKLCLSFINTDTLLKALKIRIFNSLSYHLRPCDLSLSINENQRLCFGGGGT